MLIELLSEFKLKVVQLYRQISIVDFACKIGLVVARPAGPVPMALPMALPI